MSGLHADRKRRGLPDTWWRLDRGWKRHQLAGVVSRLPRPALLRDAGDLVVSGVEPDAPRRGILAVPLPVRGLRPGAARWAHRPDSGHRAVDHLRAGELQLSRALRSERSRLCGQQRHLAPVAGVGGVCHRGAQLQGRLSGLQPGANERAGRQRFAVAIYVQQQEPRQLRLRQRPAVGHDRSHDDRGALRAGPVDARPADAARGGALRPGLELGAGRRQRHAGDVACSTRSRSRSSGR